jgi:hypothetical protein
LGSNSQAGIRREFQDWGTLTKRSIKTAVSIVPKVFTVFDKFLAVIKSLDSASLPSNVMTAYRRRR